jgi:hypothetical protein
MYSNQATVKMMNENRIGRKLKMADTVYMSGENHGETSYGLYDEWECVVPENENDAKKTGYYDWYISDERSVDGAMSWSEYRDEILSELILVEILDGRKTI